LFNTAAIWYSPYLSAHYLTFFFASKCVFFAPHLPTAKIYVNSVLRHGISVYEECHLKMAS
jgi:hypothetical protein